MAESFNQLLVKSKVKLPKPDLDVPQTLERFRIAHDLTKVQMSQLLQIHNSTYSKIIDYQVTPSAHVMTQAYKLGMPIEIFLTSVKKGTYSKFNFGRGN